MPYATDGLVGKLALQKGMISAAQLKECLGEQSVLLKAGQRRPLGVIMVSRGLMKDEDLLDLLEEQRRVLAERSNYTQVRKEDFLFGQILLKQGLATSEAINQALRTQAEAAERGEMPVPRLGQILIDMGQAEEKAIQQTLKLQYKTLYECPGCTLKYNLVEADGAKQYRCKKCGAILTPKPPGTGVKADESAYGLKLEVSEDVPPEVARAELDPANQFDKYILVNPIGRGGAGTVYRAYQKDLKRHVAIKILRADDPETLERFTREAQTAANLRHPNIVSIYEIGKRHNVPYLAMEFIDGLPLDDMDPPSFKKCAQILRDVAMAVHFAHEKGIIHRDLKPQNILVDTSGRACVTDFGLAREVAPARSITEKGIVVGTPAYMSPEQATGERQLDGRSDVASLGAVLYELLTGEQPYRGEKALDVALAVIQTTPVKPRRLRPEIPSALEAICLKAMAKNRTERYESARAFGEDLQRFLEGESVLAEQASVITTAFRRMRKHRKTSVVGAGLVAALAVLCVVLYALNREARQTNDFLRARAHEEAKEYELALAIYARYPEGAADVARVKTLQENRRRHQELDARRWRAEEALARARRTPVAAERAQIATQAIQIDEEFEEAYVVRALALQEMGKDAEAYDDLGRAVESSTSPLTHLLGRADIARRLGRLEAEIVDLTAALEWNPQSADCRLYRAWARVRLAKEGGASGPRERALELIRQADQDLGLVKRHPLLEKVQAAVQEAKAAVRQTP